MNKKPTNAKPIDLSKVLQSFDNKWVALSPDYKRVVASGDTLIDADAQVPEEQRKKVVFYKVPPADAYYIPSFL